MHVFLYACAIEAERVRGISEIAPCPGAILISLDLLNAWLTTLKYCGRVTILPCILTSLRGHGQSLLSLAGGRRLTRGAGQLGGRGLLLHAGHVLLVLRLQRLDLLLEGQLHRLHRRSVLCDQGCLQGPEIRTRVVVWLYDCGV